MYLIKKTFKSSHMNPINIFIKPLSLDDHDNPGQNFI